MDKAVHDNTAIVLATFGTTTETALNGLMAIHSAMANAFPRTPVSLAFTSTRIRRIWRRRAADPGYRAAHPEVPPEILSVRGLLAAIATLQDQGYDRLVIQPTHIAPAEEYHDLAAHVRGLCSIRTMKPQRQPFAAIALGRPLLGAYHLAHAYTDDIGIVARALADDAALAREQGAALVYMGHGNRFFPSGGLYLEFAARMRELYPDVLTLIGMVEGFPTLDDVQADLRRHGVCRVLLKPFLFAAGGHATRDLAGPDEDSWLSILRNNGYEALPVLRGLGEHPAMAQIFIDHAAQAAAEAGLELR